MTNRYITRDNLIKMKSRFSYLENVIVKTNDPEYKEIENKTGTIIGLPDPNEPSELYTIYFVYTDNGTWSVPARYLISTGQFENEKNIYPN
jgi:hypothetical protein